MPEQHIRDQYDRALSETCGNPWPGQENDMTATDLDHAARLREIADTVCWGDGSCDQPLHPEEHEALLVIAERLTATEIERRQDVGHALDLLRTGSTVPDLWTWEQRAAVSRLFTYRDGRDA